MMLKIALFVALSALSGRFYRMGGEAGTWHGKERDWGCSLCLLACLGLFTKLTLLTGLSTFCLSWGALSTYWKSRKVDCRWYNWFAHGLACGLAALPLIWCGVSTISILIRSLFLAVTMMAVSEASENVVFEEGGRGFLFCASAIFLI